MDKHEDYGTPLFLRGEYARLSAEMDGRLPWEDDPPELRWYHYVLAAPLYLLFIGVVGTVNFWRWVRKP